MYLTEKINTNANEKKETTRQGRKRSNVTQSLLDSVQAALAHITNGFTYAYANAVYLDWFVTNPVGIIGMSVSDVLDKDLYDHEKAQMDKALNGETVTSEFVIAYKQATKFVHARYLPNLNEKGRVDGFFIILTDITSDKQIDKRVEVALHESERRYHELIHGLPAAVYTTDQDGYIMMYNEAAVELWGRRPEIGKDMWSGAWKIYEVDGTTLVPPDKCPMALALQQGRKVTSTAPLIAESADGNRKYFMPYPEPILDANGNVIGGFNMLVDVTASRLAEDEKARLGTIVQSSDDAIIGKTLDGIVTSWNNAAERLFGYCEDEMIGQSITKIFPGDRLEEEPVILDKLRNGEKIDHFETKRITKDGQLIDISLTVSPVKDLQGNIIGASKIARDITEKKKVEETNAKLAAIVQSSDDAIIGKTLDGIITSWNPAAQRLFGYTEEEMIGQSIAGIIPIDRLDEEPRILSRLRSGEKVEHFETRRVTKTGKTLDISLTISAIKDSSGKIVGASKIARDISQQKEVEKLIRENDERFRMAVETANLGTWEYNVGGSTLICSSETRKICGLRDDMSPRLRDIFSHIYDEDKGDFFKEIRASLNPASQGRFDLQVRLCRFDNAGIRWVRIQGKLFFDRNRRPERFIGTLLDVNENKNTEQELRDSIERFQIMADNVPAMIWMSGFDKYDDYFNETWLKYTGRTLDQERQEGWLQNVHPDDVEKCIATYNRSFNEQKGFNTEYRLRRHDGEYRWISDNSVPRLSPDGEFQGFISACIDIDDQKRFREKIQESELLFKTISNASPAALWMTNENEENIFISDTWLKWTGKTFDEAMNRGWMDSVAGEERQAMMKDFHGSFIERKPFKAEFRFSRADGTVTWALIEAYPFYDHNEDFAGYAGSLTDITEIKKLEQRKDDFIKMASHELKTPITSINGYVQLLLNIYNEVDEQRLQLSKSTVKSSLSNIAKQVTKLTRLISELLDLSKIESGKLELQTTRFNVAELVNQIVQDVRQTASRHPILVHNEFEGKVLADKDRIAQVLLNLLTNAIKYSPEAGNIEVFVENSADFGIVRVKDFGIGVDKKDQEKIFERFYRVEGKTEQTFPGFGIGLFIASEIVQRHQGTISVESEKGKGSVFTVTIPLDKTT